MKPPVYNNSWSYTVWTDILLVYVENLLKFQGSKSDGNYEW
jgi:hypothetical protein